LLIWIWLHTLRSGVSGDVQLTDRLARSRATAGGKRHPVPGGMIETAENLRAVRHQP